MPRILFFLTLFSSSITFSQCIELYISQYIQGDPICNLSNGSTISICEDTKEIIGCPQTFYIKRVYTNANGFRVYDFALDNVYYSQKYGELQVNPKTQKLGILIGNRYGVYSYLNENQMASKFAADADRERRIQEQKLNSDKKLYDQINQAINKKDYQTAKSTLIKLNFPNNFPKYQEYKLLERKYLLDNDIANYPKIKSLIDNLKLIEAQSEIKKLNFPDEFPYKEQFNVKFDEETIKEINSNLSNNNFSDASRLYETLKLLNNQTQQRSFIQSKIESFYSDKADSMPQLTYIKYINENSSEFKALKPGKYILKIDRSGNVFLSDKVIGSSKDITERKYGSFSVKTTSEVTLNITETYVPQGDQKYLASSNKRIFSKPNGKKYKAVFMGGPGLFGGIGLDLHKLVQVTFDSNIPKNQLKTVQPSLKKIVINNKIEIPQNIENILIKEEKIKARWLAIGTRSFALLSGISWSALRLYEYTLIP